MQIKSRDDKPLWVLLKEFINNRVKVGKKFTRRNMFNYVYPDMIGKMVWSKVHTIDNYRAHLMKVEILSTSNKRGVYIKMRDVPNDLTLSKLIKITNDHSWRRWFIPMEEKL